MADFPMLRHYLISHLVPVCLPVQIRIALDGRTIDKMISHMRIYFTIIIIFHHWTSVTCTNGLPGVLFVFDSWRSNQGGLTAFHRELVNDFAIRKQREVNIYSTVLYVDDSEESKDFEEISLNVNLIFPRVKKRLKNNKPNIEWLINHESFYPGLREIDNIKNVIGYAPKTADAAFEIRDALFPSARLILINHLIPDDEYTTVYDDTETLADQMLKWAWDADIIFSIGPGMHIHFTNEYRADLYEKPHKEYLPRPSDFFFAKGMYLPQNIDKHVILTYGQANPLKGFCVDEDIVSGVCQVADSKRMMRDKSTIWKFHDIAGSDQTEMPSFLNDLVRNPNVKINPSSSTAYAELARHIQQSHLCLVATCYEEYSFDGLEAMAIGLPLLASDESQIAKYLTKYFARYKDKCIVANPADNWPNRIRDVLVDLVTAFETARDLKKDFKESVNITNNHKMFAAVIKTNEKAYEKDKSLMQFTSNVDLPVNVALNETSYNQTLSTNECKRHSSNDIESIIKDCKDKKIQRIIVKQTWETCINTFEYRLMKIERHDESWRFISDISRQCYANLKDIKAGSVILILQFSDLYDLYKFEGMCRSGKFASLLEPILINDSMRELASTVNISLQLQTSYDQDIFVEIEAFLIKRDGGQTEENEFSEEIEDVRQENISISSKYLYSLVEVIVAAMTIITITWFWWKRQNVDLPQSLCKDKEEEEDEISFQNEQTIDSETVSGQENGQSDPVLDIPIEEKEPAPPNELHFKRLRSPPNEDIAKEKEEATAERNLQPKHSEILPGLGMINIHLSVEDDLPNISQSRPKEDILRYIKNTDQLPNVQTYLDQNDCDIVKIIHEKTLKVLIRCYRLAGLERIWADSWGEGLSDVFRQDIIIEEQYEHESKNITIKANINTFEYQRCVMEL